MAGHAEMQPVCTKCYEVDHTIDHVTRHTKGAIEGHGGCCFVCKTSFHIFLPRQQCKRCLRAACAKCLKKRARVTGHKGLLAVCEACWACPPRPRSRAGSMPVCPCDVRLQHA